MSDMTDKNEKFKRALEVHAQLHGKLAIHSKLRADSKEALSILYTPGVAAPCLEIAQDKELAYTYTGKGNDVAVITDGSAVLGLGNIGLMRPCRSWKGSACCSASLPASTPCPCA